VGASGADLLDRLASLGPVATNASALGRYRDRWPGRRRPSEPPVAVAVVRPTTIGALQAIGLRAVKAALDPERLLNPGRLGL
jgi:FAD/FMN-containing dehydrogenase